MKIDLARVREIVDLFAESRATELTVAGPEFSITVRKSIPMQAPPAAARPSLRREQPEFLPIELQESELGSVPAKSTAVGFVHLDRTDDEGPFVRVGATVIEGQIVCLVESMNVKHEVHAPCHGTIEKIDVDEGEPVEYGKPLMWIDPSASVENP